MEDSANPDGGTATLETEPVATETGTAKTDGKTQGNGAPVEEGFTKVDPKTLPPQLRESYNNMLRDYKEKTTKLSEMTKAEVAKAVSEYKDKAAFYDQFTTQEDAVKFWNDHVQKVNSKGQPVDNNGDPIKELKSEVDQLKQERLEAKLSSVIDGFAEAVDDKGEPIAPHFEKLNSMVIGQTQGRDGKPEDFSLLRATTQLAPGNTPEEKLANGYKMAEKFYNAILEEGKKAGMDRVQAKVKNSNLAPGGSSTISGVQIVEKKNLNAHEALKLARQGKLVSRE